MVTRTEYIAALETAATLLLAESGYSAAGARRQTRQQQRLVVAQLLCVRSPSGESPATAGESPLLAAVDGVLAYEAARAAPVDAAALATIGASQLALWRGDMTLLRCGAIANAANSALLGCFQPDHKCIDNIIHARAGPRLRDACAARVATLEDPQRGLPVGQAVATPGFHLPAKYVLHTVGPQIQRNTVPTELQNNQLVACYLNCLDLALTLDIPDLTIAFPCISTGLYGFPSHLAAPLVIQAVKTWLATHQAQASGWKVIFNTFLEKDLLLYTKHIRQLFPDTFIPPQPSLLNSQLESAKSLIQSADYLIVSAGAGLSASAGLDYTSESVFKKHHPVMHTRGFRNMYQFIGYSDWPSPALQWGYLFAQTNLARYNWKQHETQPTYPLLKSLVDGFEAKTPASTYIVTSNADGMFSQYGFDASRIYTRQGDYSRLQCLKPCSQDAVWDIKPFMEKGLAYLDPETNEITNPEAIPKCCKCGGDVMLNVRGGDWFIETEYLKQRIGFEAWKAGVLRQVRELGKKLVVLEIGAGFNTPGVLRYPNEQLADCLEDYGDDNGGGGGGGVSLVRVNPDHFDIPVLVNGCGVKADGTLFLKEVVSSLP